MAAKSATKVVDMHCRMIGNAGQKRYQVELHRLHLSNLRSSGTKNDADHYVDSLDR